MLPLRIDFSLTIHPAYYLLKVASMHGYADLKDMINAHGFRFPSKLDGNLESYNQIIKATTGIESDLKELQGFEYDKSRYLTSLIYKGVNICPTCLDEGHVDFDTRYLTTTYCDVHQCKTVQTCNHCSEELQWDNELLKGLCSHCGNKLQTQYSETPAYITFMENLDKEMIPLLLDDLSLAVGFVLRPFDIVPERVNRNSLKKWEHILEVALSLLTNARKIENWLANIRANTRFTDYRSIYAGPRFMIRNAKMEWPIFKQVLAETNINECISVAEELSSISPKDFGIKPSWKTKGLNETEQDELAQSKTPVDTLADVLSCNVNEANLIIKNGFLKTLRSAKTGVTAQVDIRELNAIVLKVDFQENETFANNLLSNDFLKLFYCDLADVFEMLRNTPKIFTQSKSTDGFFKRLKVNDTRQFLKTILSIYEGRLDEKVTEAEAVTLFGFTQKDLKALWQQELAYSLPWQQGATYFRIRDLENIENKVFNLKRYCLVRNIDFGNLKAEMSKSNIDPIVGDSFYQCKTQAITYIKEGKSIQPIRTFKTKRLNNWPFQQIQPA